MSIPLDLYNLSFQEKFVSTIGVFDGLHKGHQKVIRKVITLSKRFGYKSSLITFWPHPQSILNPAEFRGYIYPLSYRIKLIKEMGIEYCIVLNFSKRISRMDAEKFFDFILSKLNLKILVIGEDFRIGKDQLNFHDLKSLLEKKNIELIREKSVCLKGERISSTNIKHLISTGEFSTVSQVLGRQYCIVGKVIKGSRRGHRLGFPTANIDTHQLILPPQGVYICKLLIKNKLYFGLLSISSRPTFSGKKVCTEVFIFNFSSNLYGEILKVCPLKFIRYPVKFSSSDKLIAQIKKDLVKLKNFLRGSIYN